MERDDLDLERLKAIVEGDYVAPPKAPFDVQVDDLYGGITGMALPVQAFEILLGITLRRTFAHVMVPFVMAFRPPAKPSAPYPGPWAALSEGGLTILTEMHLSTVGPTLGFERLNTLWFLTALMRLRLALPLQMAVLADRPFSEIPAAVEATNLLTVECDLTRLLTAPPRIPTEVDLEWVRANVVAASELMKTATFNRALQTLDEAVAARSPGAGIVIAWASIETLIKPGSRQITDRVSRALATHLYPPGPDRDRAFGQILASYEARGGTAHAGAIPEAEQFRRSFDLARAALMRSIEQQRLPDVDDLLDRWKAKA